MSDTSARDWRLYVSDMAMIAENVLHYTSRMTQSQFVADRKTFDATVLSELQATFSVGR